MKNREINSIQALRGIAALMVVIRHSIENVNYSEIIWIKRVWELGAAGVDIFFVVSGFVMMYTSFDDFQQPRASVIFLKKRLIRIAPLYWLITGFIIAALIFIPQLFGQLTFNLYHAFASMLFLPAYNSAGYLYPLLVPGWTLAYEMFFYVLFSVILIFNRKHSLLLLLLIFSFFTISGGSSKNPFLLTYTNPLLFEFFFGCIIGYYFKERKFLDDKIYWIFIVTGLSIFIFTLFFGRPETHRVIHYGIPSALVVSFLVWKERLEAVCWPVFMTRLGDFSYSLYLIHVIIIAVVCKLLKNNPPLLIFIFCMFFSIVGGYGLWLFFEKPVARWLKKIAL